MMTPILGQNGLAWCKIKGLDLWSAGGDYSPVDAYGQCPLFAYVMLSSRVKHVDFSAGSDLGCRYRVVRCQIMVMMECDQGKTIESLGCEWRLRRVVEALFSIRADSLLSSMIVYV